MKTISEYIDNANPEAKTKLKQMLACVRKAAPDATEELKYGVPALSYKRILVMFAGFKHHIGFYPTPSAIVAFKKELVNYKTAEGTIQFPLDKPLPLTLITKITKHRVKESLAEDKKWKLKKSC